MRYDGGGGLGERDASEAPPKDLGAEDLGS